MSILRRTADGRILCNAHRTSGAPAYHTDGCDACEEAKAKGIVRPPSVNVAPSKRRGRRLPGPQNWGTWRQRQSDAELVQKETAEAWLKRNGRATG